MGEGALPFSIVCSLIRAVNQGIHSGHGIRAQLRRLAVPGFGLGEQRNGKTESGLSLRFFLETAKISSVSFGGEQNNGPPKASIPKCPEGRNTLILQGKGTLPV